MPIFWEVIISAIFFRKRVHMNRCLIRNGYREGAVWSYRPNCIRPLFVGLEEEQSLQNEGGYTRLIVRSYSGSCSPHKGTWRSTQMNNTRSSHTICKFHRGWKSDFRTFIMNCKKFIVSVLTDLLLKNLTKLAVK